MTSPSETPGASPSGTPDGGTAAVTADGLIPQLGEIDSTTQALGGPAEGSAEPGSTSSDTDTSIDAAESDDEQATAEAEAAVTAEDARDLEQYPESVRERFKTLKPSERRALYEHAETNARAQVEAEREARQRVEQAEAERQAKVQAILDSQGAFVGARPVKLRGQDGQTFDGPTYDELDRSLKTRVGRQQLWDRYGLDEDQAEATLTELDERRAMLDGSANVIEQGVTARVALRFKAALEAVNGVNADEIVAGADSQGQDAAAVIVQRLVATLEERHSREMTALKRDYDGRIDAHTANEEGMRGRVTAAEARRLPTGGRSGSTATRKSVRERLIEEAGGIERFSENAAQGRYVGINLDE